MKKISVIIAISCTVMLLNVFSSGAEIKSVDEIKQALMPEAAHEETPVITKGLQGVRPADKRPSVTLQLQFNKNSSELTPLAVEQLKNARDNMIGVILNQTRASRGYGYYHHYYNKEYYTGKSGSNRS